jgi:hypothetical protein
MLLIDGFDDPQGIAYLATYMAQLHRGLQSLARIGPSSADDELNGLVEFDAWRGADSGWRACVLRGFQAILWGWKLSSP